MPIHIPGKRDKHGKVGAGKREAIATLSLTAMVDMFTVLTIFLLQNYKETGEVIKLRKDVELPQASQIRELTPSQVVIITKDMVLLNDLELIERSKVEVAKDWLIRPLYIELKKNLLLEEQEYRRNLQNRIKKVVNTVREKEQKEEDLKKITLQADKDVDFLTIKKIMYTITEAGSSEIHFAVITNEDKRFKKPKDDSIEEGPQG